MVAYLFPGIAATADGSEAVVWVETHVTQGRLVLNAIYEYGGGYRLAAADGQRNLRLPISR